MVTLHGEPDRLATVQEMTPDELDVVRSSMKDGRAHDITLYIKKDNGYIFIAKPFYPPGLYRAPSGGIRPDEDFDSGAKREALEETGVEIALEQYILRIDVRFQTQDDYIDWTSYVFSALHVGGAIEPRDKQEIKEAKLVTADEVPGFIDLMLKSRSGGLMYRAFLTKETGKRLN
jgi:ADP-ribose pyrophosphatase YjhB (NUDIX family)